MLSAGWAVVSLAAIAASGLPRAGAPFIDFTPHGTQPDLAHDLIGSQNCMSCHSGSAQQTHYPADGWAGSMMANATRDPLFWAALDVANADGAENGAEGIGEWCLRCHTPKGWYEGRVRKTVAIAPGSTPLPGEVVDGFQGCLLEGGPDYWADDASNDFGGVGCHTCHRVMDQGPAGQPLMTGNADIWLDDANCNGQPGAGPCRAGPYAYPVDMGGWDYEPPHAWKHSPLHSDSAICGSCHDVTSPTLETGPFRTLILANGTPQGHDTGLAYPIERTYSEWQQSAYASTLFRDGMEPDGDDVPGRIVARTEHCQHCHMPQAQPPSFDPDAELQVCSMGGPNRSGNLPTHELVGGNAWIPQILKGEYPGLKRDLAFDRTSYSATRMLAERTAEVETRATRTGSGLSIQVKVTNLSGHKLPSGYGEGRRMWLDVDVRDAHGTPVWRNGAFDPATGDLVIDAQTKIYEIKQGLWDDTTGTCRTKDGQGRDIFHFALNDCVAKDNRIPPLGFTGGGDPETASYAYSYPETAPGSGVSVNFDVTHYSVPLPADVAWPVTVDARMKYQIASKDYIEFLRDQAVERGFPAENALCVDGPGRPYSVGPQDKSRGQYMYDLWANPAYGRSPPLDAGQYSLIVQGP
ncbi:hypothetical protein OS187_00085 [Xanthomonadaceae bacterium JHOS43]|nr:hypothetical protein [Xanthomonadaceae bacterium JHOS43]